MKLEICDKCSGIMGLPFRVVFKEPVDGRVTEICLCDKCFKEILDPLKLQQQDTHTKCMDFIKENNVAYIKELNKNGKN